MRVDTSLLDGINAANAAAKASSTKLKSTGTTSSFSAALKSAEEKETTRAVPGTNYHEILTGPRAGMYLNKSGNERDGQAFVLVKENGREHHIYGTGKDRKVISSGGDRSEPATEADTSSSTGAPRGVRAGERIKPVEGRAYVDILNGSRSGMYINTSGNVRDGQAFVLVNRDGREYHIYGSGKDRTVVSLKPPSARTEQAEPTQTASTDPGAAKTGTSLVDSTT